MKPKYEVISVTPNNVETYGLFCIKSQKNPGYIKKRDWFLQEYPKGLRLKILQEESGRQLGFIEYTPAEQAWRPVEAPSYLFIHCMYIYKKEDRRRGNASLLIKDCVEDARRQGKAGVAVMTSDGPWIASKDVFFRNGFEQVDQRGGFELLHYPLAKNAPPRLTDREVKPEQHQSWQLLYANQCPWHQKCAEELLGFAKDKGIPLQITEITNSATARNGASPFGVFALVRGSKLLEYHYISKTRFMNILKTT
ncbi:MAG: GNAT family N-acetyltransferase [Lewinellaceae bacterium]|nr:GNAT family N-acetyltransferase [Phaeodactylibacter sp.]MCB9346783.1 GNAT family N-acetyltransferase [Lewinellaceae bacterium]